MQCALNAFLHIVVVYLLDASPSNFGLVKQVDVFYHAQAFDFV